MIAQRTVSGGQLKCGDLLSSGGISGLGQREKGSLMERNRGEMAVDVGLERRGCGWWMGMR